jgi:hypothetical protein
VEAEAVAGPAVGAVVADSAVEAVAGPAVEAAVEAEAAVGVAGTAVIAVEIGAAAVVAAGKFFHEYRRRKLFRNGELEPLPVFLADFVPRR